MLRLTKTDGCGFLVKPKQGGGGSLKFQLGEVQKYSPCFVKFLGVILTTLTEDYLNGRHPQFKTTSMEDKLKRR